MKIQLHHSLQASNSHQIKKHKQNKNYNSELFYYHTMTPIFLFLGLFFIAIGFAVKAFPNLIAGYNTLTKAQKENIDIKGLSTHIRNSLIVTGLLIIIGCYSLTWLGFERAAGVFKQVVVWGGLVYTIVRSRKYDLRKKRK